MPLFHIHGLIAAVVSSLAAGGSVVCSPGFNAFRFFAWFAAIRPTWYTAVPTVHQAILPLAARNRAAIEAGRLRLIRSSSASLPPPVMRGPDAAFGVPVLESYGMVSALTGATLDRLTGEPGLRAICRAMMVEAQAVAEALGGRFAIDLERRIAGAAEVGSHKTSMLQDLERGRPMEIDALLGAVVELAAMVDRPAALCETVLALVRERARQAGCYPTPSGPA